MPVRWLFAVPAQLLLCAAVIGCSTIRVDDRRSPEGTTPGTSASARSVDQTARAPAVSAQGVTVPPVTRRADDARALLDRLLPRGVDERDGWAVDILTAFGALQIPPDAERLCAVIAVIEQESSFVADPPVPGLARIAWQEIDRRRERYGIPKLVLDLALGRSSPDGRSYRERVDALRTEKQMSLLYEEMIAELPGGRTLFAGYNPVRTGGPMQVGIEFAEEQVRRKPYPYPRSGGVRAELFTRRGGVYFGVASLLDYPVNYGEMIYRFADFNAGRYSSRNAAFQDAVVRLSGRQLALDGDLLRYREGVALSEVSDSQRAVIALQGRLQMAPGEIGRDLRLEKSAAFEKTPLYLRLYALADAASGGRRPRETLPQIALSSPKISRRLTTEWFARRVDGRYRSCLARSRQEG